jgi:hypothetical protein
MATLDISATRDLLQNFDFGRVFIQELGWSQPTNRHPVPLPIDGTHFERREIAELGGVVVFEITSADGNIPNAKIRAALHKQISQQYHENLLIFVDEHRTQSLWYWVKREGSKRYPREHHYFRGQPGDLFLSKLSSVFFDMSDLDAEGNISVVQVAQRLKAALDVEPVTKKFYKEYQEEHVAFTELIAGIDDEHERRWYASVLLNRLMFIYFLQRKYFLDNGNASYLEDKLEESKKRGLNRYYREFLVALFFEGFAKPEDLRSPEVNALLGRIRYLNGGLFLPHSIETRYPDIEIPDEAFENLLNLFARYSWNLDDTPGGKDDEINPSVLGYIFEKYINQKAFGAYYTRPEITEYLCEQTIHRLILDKINRPGIPGITTPRQFNSMADLLMNLEASLCRELLFEVLPKLSLLDPACGSGAFLVAAMKTLINIFSAITGKIEFLNDNSLTKWLKEARAEHRSLSYYLKKRIITDNLFGVDIMDEGAEIARLRLFLALVGSVQSVDQLEPLPNIDFNILVGNSLIGLLRVDERTYDDRQKQGRMFQKPYHEIVAEKDRLVRSYRDATNYAEDLRALRDEIEKHRGAATAELDDILLDEFKELGIQYGEYTWDAKKGELLKKRSVRIGDIRTLRPFHWGYEFDQVMNERGGFDAIITNPPWEIFKPNGKEFFEQYSDLVRKKKMRIEEFEDEREDLLRDREIRAAWLEYLSQYPYIGAYYRRAKQYASQTSIINGKKAASDTNLYKLFVEQCYNLMAQGGRCGIIVPSGIYTDLGSKQLRELLFSQAEVNTLFGLSNERFIFENLHHGFKFTLLVFEKGGQTDSFTAAFRINPREAIAPEELDDFLYNTNGHLMIRVDLVRRLSPDSLSVMELRTPADVQIAEKMSRFPSLGAHLGDMWNVELTREFDMTQKGARKLVHASQGIGLSPLYEGKMIWQFEHGYSEPQYWVRQAEIRKHLLGKKQDKRQLLSYQAYRLVFRRQSASTNERTLISTLIPPAIHADNLASVAVFDGDGRRQIQNAEQVLLCAFFNSFVVDYSIKQRVTTNLNFFYLYQLPIPRLTTNDAASKPIVERAARLICTTPEFDDLAREVGLKSHKDGVTDLKGRARVRAELDGIIAHLYGLTEDEFTHILASFPLVDQSVKDATLDAFHAFAPNPDDQQLEKLTARGEGPYIELKVGAIWNPNMNQKDGTMKQNVLEAVASFMNSKEGGAVVIGVDKKGNMVGISQDVISADPQKKNRDGYELFLRNTIATALGADVTNFYSIAFHQINDVEICRIRVAPASKPVYLNGDLYIRDGNGKRKLKAQEVPPYIKERWG